MVKRKVLKKITRIVKVPEKEVEADSSEVQSVQSLPAKRRCNFCKTNTKPSYTDSQALRKFVSDRGKILPKLKTGVCSKHQRTITEQIKYARHLSLLPFTQKV